MQNGSDIPKRQPDDELGEHCFVPEEPNGSAVEDVCSGCGHKYHRLPHATSGLCCGCRRLKRDNTMSTERRPATLPGAFHSQAALDEWYSADALRCHICGESFAGLYRHVGLAHGLSTRDYKKQFGIPMGYGLAGRKTRMMQRACGVATTGKMRDAGFQNLANGRKAKTGTRAQWTAYQVRDHVALMVESPEHPSNYEGDVDVTCTSCGNPFPMPASIVLAFQCRAKCPGCA